MAPIDLRQQTKFDRVRNMLLVIMTNKERDEVVKLYGKLSTEDIFQISAPINNQPQNEAVIALELIDYYIHGRRPAELPHLHSGTLEREPALSDCRAVKP